MGLPSMGETRSRVGPLARHAPQKTPGLVWLMPYFSSQECIADVIWLVHATTPLLLNARPLSHSSFARIDRAATPSQLEQRWPESPTLAENGSSARRNEGPAARSQKAPD